MKKKDVPQDDSNLQLAGKELCYATDERGNYLTELSSGWEPKTIALNNAIREIETRVEEARQRVINKQTSPIEYYMELNKMDVSILSSYVGYWPFFVKRHFKPRVFNRLKEQVLQKYANVFEISIEELQDIS